MPRRGAEHVTTHLSHGLPTANLVETKDGSDGCLISGTYRLLRRIGAGAMGVVYEAEHVRLSRRFAMKILQTQGELTRRSVDLFCHETRMVASVESEYVVSPIDCGQLDDGTPFMVTELLRGRDLRCRLAEVGVLELEESVRIARELCYGLSAVHALGIIHRDLKPENVFLAERGLSVPVCKILDFGVAKLVTSPKTERGALIGTVGYMAPEQILDASQVGPQADIYSIGAILFECLTGQAPYAGVNPLAILARKGNPAEGLRALRPDLSADLVDVIASALAANPQMRFARVEDLATALTVCSPEQIPHATPRLVGGDIHAPRALRRPSLLRRLTLHVPFAAALIGVVTLWGSARSRGVSGEPALTKPAAGEATLDNVMVSPSSVPAVASAIPPSPVSPGSISPRPSPPNTRTNLSTRRRGALSTMPSSSRDPWAGLAAAPSVASDLQTQEPPPRSPSRILRGIDVESPYGPP